MHNMSAMRVWSSSIFYEEKMDPNHAYHECKVCLSIILNMQNMSQKCVPASSMFFEKKMDPKRA
jgi:hypothetical protein